MSADRAKGLPFIEAAQHRLPHHPLEVLPVIGFGDDAVPGSESSRLDAMQG